MRLSVGLDILDVSEVEESLRMHGVRYLRRLYTERELADCVGPGGAPDSRALAVRFAAKEAALKALGAGVQAIPWSSVEMSRDGVLRLSGPAAALARRRGARELSVSVAQTKTSAAAVVLAWEDEPR